MSTNTATIERVQPPRPRAAGRVSVEFQPAIEDTVSDAWRQINAILSDSLSESGLPQPGETADGDWRVPPESPVVIAVAPGIAVETDEYQKRYGSIDLEQYRQQMSPELFRVFVRHIGRIPGTPGLDLGDIVTTPD